MARLDFVVPLQQEVDFNQLLSNIDMDMPTEESVLRYLFAVHDKCLSQGVECMPVEQFYQAGDVDEWIAATREYSAECLSNTHFALCIKTLLCNALHAYPCPTTQRQIVSFKDRINRAILLINKQNAQPTEEQEKRRQQNREAQRRFNLRRKNDGSPESVHAHVVKAAYDEYMLACRQRKEAEAQWAQYVASKKAAWESIKAQKPLN
jgi:hypothetical protein